MADLDLGLFLTRLISSSLLFALTLTLTLLKSPREPASQQGPSEIVAVLAPVRTARRGAIILCGIALSVFWIADAAVIAGRGIIEKEWEPAEPVWRGEEVAIILNFLTWTGVIGIGVFKESYGREIWTSATLKLLTLLAGAAEITTFVLLCIALRVFQSRCPYPP
ncbi:hypothetical protein CALVIDRAFT_504221, partial [Calocera viscosa TUFC12733]